jgi:hypothetical protein
MLRFSLSIIAVIVFTSSLCEPRVARSGAGATVLRLDGAYEFVSETTSLTKPTVVTTSLSAPEWQGFWFFQGNHFSQTIMKRGRLYATYPRFHHDLGYNSFAGTYAIDGNTIRLRKQLALHPLSAGRSVTLTYQIKDDTLTLIEVMNPYPEDLSQGQRITVLRKIE